MKGYSVLDLCCELLVDQMVIGFVVLCGHIKIWSFAPIRKIFVSLLGEEMDFRVGRPKTNVKFIYSNLDHNLTISALVLRTEKIKLCLNKQC